MNNKNLFYHIIVTLALLFTEASTFGQSIDSLVNETLQNNPQLKSIQYRIKAAGYKAASVNTYPAPSLSLEFSQVPTGSVNILNDAISNNIGISQMFPIGGKIPAMVNVENKNGQVEEESYKVYSTSLTAQVKMSYYALWLIERKIEIQQKTIELLNDLLKNSLSSFSLNNSSQADILILKSEIASNEVLIPQLVRQRESETIKLNKLLGRPLESKQVTAEKELPSVTLDVSQSALEEILHEKNPDLSKMDRMIDMNKAMIDANERELIPDLMVQGMLMRMPRGMILTAKSDLSMLEPKTEYMYSLMFSVNLPFMPWSKDGNKAKSEQLSAGISGIQYEKEDMERDMKSKLKESLIKYQSSVESAKLYEESVIPLYEQAVEAQMSAYRNNSANINAVLDASRMLLMQQMNLYMAKADGNMAIAEIEMMTGTRSLTNKKLN